MASRQTLELIRKLDAIDASDPERAHAEAEEALLVALPLVVREAYDRLKERAAWWASA